MTEKILVTRCCKFTANMVETNYHNYWRCDVCNRPTEMISIDYKMEDKEHVNGRV